MESEGKDKGSGFIIERPLYQSRLKNRQIVKVNSSFLNTPLLYWLYEKASFI